MYSISLYKEDINIETVLESFSNKKFERIGNAYYFYEKKENNDIVKWYEKYKKILTVSEVKDTKDTTIDFVAKYSEKIQSGGISHNFILLYEYVGKIFLFTEGNAHHSIDKTLLVDDFGKKICWTLLSEGLAIPVGSKSKEVGVNSKVKTAVAQKNITHEELAFFDSSQLISSLKIKVKKSNEKLYTKGTLEGSHKLVFNSDFKPEDIEAIFDHLIFVYDKNIENEFYNTLSNNIVETLDFNINSILEFPIKNFEFDHFLSYDDYDTIGKFTINGIEKEFHIGDSILECEFEDNILFSDIKNRIVKYYDNENQMLYRKELLDIITIDFVENNTNVIFMNKKFYKFSNLFRNKINSVISTIPVMNISNLDQLVNLKTKEESFNKKFSEINSSNVRYVLFDKKLIYTDGQERYELCDVLGIKDDGTLQFFHVKGSGKDKPSSSSVSHWVHQVQTSRAFTINSMSENHSSNITRILQEQNANISIEELQESLVIKSTEYNILTYTEKKCRLEDLTMMSKLSIFNLFKYSESNGMKLQYFNYHRK